MPKPAKPWLWGELLELAAPPTLTVRAEDAPPEVPQVDLSYIVVDEIDDEETVVLIIEDWPVVDKRGRRRFPGRDDRATAAVTQADLRALLQERQAFVAQQPADPRSLAERALRVGDAFGARVDRDALAKTPELLRTWLNPPFLDVSAPAREAAKVQYYAAVGPVMPEKQVIEIAAEFFEGYPGPEPGEPR